jgi:cytosine/adenosine deaminase-related metal-dependent hydrolase
MPSSLVRGKYVICRVDDRGRPVIVEDGAVFQRDGLVLEVGKFDDLAARHAADTVIGDPEDVVFPGLINAHHHVGLTPLQLGTPDLALELWVVHRVGARAVDLYLDTLYSAFEMVESGVTTVQHLHGRVPAPVERVVRAADEVIRAYDDIGMRVSYSFGIRDQNRLIHGEADEDLVRRLPPDLAPDVAALLKAQTLSAEEGIEVFEILHRRYAERERVRVQLAPGNLHWCSDRALELVADTARRYGVTRHMHLSETAFQKEYALRRTGTTAVQHLQRLGVLGPDLTLGHGVWLTEHDIDLVAETGTCICHNCSSNLRLRSGVAALNVLRRRGICVVLGIDEAGINDDRDMLQEMRLVLRLHRIPGMDDDDVPTCADVFRMATEAGALTTPFGAKIGVLEPGRAADMVILPWKAVAFPFLDPDVPVLDAIVQRAVTGTVDTVIVAGEPILRGGRFTRIDKEAMLAELAARMGSEPTEMDTHRRALARRLLPYARGFYQSYVLDETKREPYYKPSSKV